MKIRVDQQIGPECALATLAALSGKPYDQVRERACEIAGSTWCEVMGSPDLCWESLLQLGREMGIEGMIVAWRVSYYPPACSLVPTVPAKGRGSVMIIDHQEKNSHMMAY